MSVVDLKRFEEESKEMFPLPSREGTESREGRRGPRSCRSRCSRFKKLKQSVRWNLTAKGAKTANKKGSVRCIFNRETRESREKFVWSASPCSYPSLCSRFIEFKGSVRSISNRERRENREQKRSVPCRSEAVRGRVQGEFPLSSRVGTESREGRRGLQ